MPLSFVSSQNSLLSATRARNYDHIILLSSYLNGFLASRKISQYSPARSLLSPYPSIPARCRRRVHTSRAWTRWQLLRESLETILIRHVCGFSLLLARALPITEQDHPSSTPHPVDLELWPRPADCRIRISSNVIPVELAIALDRFPASCNLYTAKAEDPAPATRRVYGQIPLRSPLSA